MVNYCTFVQHVKKNIERMSNISERLLEERKRLGFNQDQMAKIGEIAKRTYCNYESGEREPMASFYSLIASVGADVQYIITGIRSGSVQYVMPNTGSLTRREAALLDNYRNIVTEEDKSVVERTALMAAKASQGETKSGTKKVG